jgi:hypothetical protein
VTQRSRVSGLSAHAKAVRMPHPEEA